MGLAADFQALGADQKQQAVLNGNLAAAQAAVNAGNQTITTASQQVVTDLQDTSTYPSGTAYVADPASTAGGILVLSLTPNQPPGFSAQPVPQAQ
ncbi:MAG TPA: hypothetical protein VKX24_13030 [Acidimicrobiia bacterium]|nr:hypothetical protein [Acidimicrobiia bacterium]